MSVLSSTMYTNQLNSPFAGHSHHVKASSFSELFAQLKPQLAARKMRSVSPSSLSSHSLSRKRRSHSDQSSYCSSVGSSMGSDLPALKRPRTAPASPTLGVFASSKSHAESVSEPAAKNITLPSIGDALGDIAPRSARLPSLKTQVPTVSLDYFDTYKPNDENWRYGLLDSIRHTKPAFSLDKYAYLDKHAKLPSIHELGKMVKPCFDSRVSSKALPTFAQRKINFPYESNYTYLNKTYLYDVEKFPEYLELAQSLVSLSRPAGEMPKVTTEPVQYSHQEPFHDLPMDPRVRQDRPTSPQYAGYSSESQCRHVPSSPHMPGIGRFPYATPEQSFEISPSSPQNDKSSAQRTRFIPITPPSVKNKTRSELMKSPPRIAQNLPRVCISCGSDQSPCWRPSWSTSEGQLCNSCGLRYKKTAARCLNSECKKIPAKGEWALMQSKGKTTFEDGEQAYGCLNCGCKVEVKR